jgi:hypothetical protein
MCVCRYQIQAWEEFRAKVAKARENGRSEQESRRKYFPEYQQKMQEFGLAETPTFSYIAINWYLPAPCIAPRAIIHCRDLLCSLLSSSASKKSSHSPSGSPGALSAPVGVSAA